MRTTYPSDVTNEQWHRIADLIPPPEKLGRHRSIDEREVLNAINYRWSTGCSWRMLPHDFPQWGTVYAYFRRWQRVGILREIRTTLLGRHVQSNKTATAPQPFATTHQPRSSGRAVS